MVVMDWRRRSGVGETGHLGLAGNVKSLAPRQIRVVARLRDDRVGCEVAGVALCWSVEFHLDTGVA